MDAKDIKVRILDYIENADDRILRIFNAIIETEENELPSDRREELDTRLQYHKEHPEEGKTWEEIRGSLKKQHGV